MHQALACMCHNIYTRLNTYSCYIIIIIQCYSDKNNWASLTAAVGVSATGLMSLIYYFISLLLLIFVILIMIMVIFVFCHKKKQN